MTSQAQVQDKPKQKSRLHITNRQNDARYKATGFMLALKKSPDYDDELKTVNHKKNGSPYKYPESLFMSLAIIRNCTRMSFRVLAGFAEASIGSACAPSYSQIHKRINSIKVTIKDNIITAVGKKGVLRMAIDGTGLSPSARSEYIRHKHKIKHGFIRLLLVVDVDTREILSFSVTDERVGEAPQFERLTCTALENSGIESKECGQPNSESEKDSAGVQATDKSEQQNASDSALEDMLFELIMYGDGGFDSREIFQICKKLGITARIRMRVNAAIRSRGVSRDRSLAAIEQLGGGVSDPKKFAQLTNEEREANRKKWKKRVKYGNRWISEIVISSFKRLFGDSVAAIRWNHVVHEIALKVDTYNQILWVHREAIAAA